MDKCDFCGKEGFRNLKGFFLCVKCYRANINDKTNNTAKVIKVKNPIETKPMSITKFKEVF